MKRLADLARDFRGRADNFEPISEADEYELCPVCGEAFDRRILSEVFYHAESDYHEPWRTLQ